MNEHDFRPSGLRSSTISASHYVPPIRSLEEATDRMHTMQLSPEVMTYDAPSHSPVTQNFHWQPSDPTFQSPQAATTVAPSTGLLSPLAISDWQDSAHVSQPRDFSADSEMSRPSSPESVFVPRERRKAVSRSSVIQGILKSLDAAKLTPTDLLATLLDPESHEFAPYQAAFFSARNAEKLACLMSMIWKHERRQHVNPHPFLHLALETVCNTIHKEMDCAKPHLTMNLRDVTPDFTETWDVATIMGPLASDITPTWTAVLDAATETNISKSKPRLPRSRNRQTVRVYVMYCMVVVDRAQFTEPLHD